MLKLLILALAVGALSAAMDAEWAVFKAKHVKVYDEEEDTIRRSIWAENRKKIESHNALFAKGMTSYWLGENEYADMTTSEFVGTMTAYMRPAVKTLPTIPEESPRNSMLPSEVNWVKKGYVTRVKNQGACASGWAFAATGGLEGAHFKTFGKLVSLSESNLIDCSSYTGNKGCKSGWAYKAYFYAYTHGVDTEESYPYIPKDGQCKYNGTNVGTTEKTFIVIRTDSEPLLQKYLASVGPISVTIDASHSSFHLYSGGVYDEPKCNSTNLTHGMLLVGYGVYQGKEYYLVKNSFGESWGLKGYIMMSRNKNNQCGIATNPCYPVV